MQAERNPLPGRILRDADWLREEPWQGAPAALAEIHEDGEVSWNLACRVLLRETVGGTSPAWRRWLLAAAAGIEASGQDAKVMTAGPDSSLAVELRLGRPSPLTGSRIVFLQAVAPRGEDRDSRPDPAALSETVSNLSHELRSPLTAIKASLGMVLQGEAGDLRPDQAHFLELAMRNIDRLDRLTTDLLDTARGEAGKLVLRPREVDLGPLLREGVRLHAEAAHKAGLTFDTRGLPRSFLACLDADRLLQVLDNLVGNAVKYTEAPGVVRVWVEQRPAPPSGLVWTLAEQCFLPLHQFTLVIEDSGRGIPEAMRSRLFGRFERAHPEAGDRTPGSGLGLHITRGLVGALGGTIRLSTREGQGTTIWVRLPRDQESLRLLQAAELLGRELDQRTGRDEGTNLVLLDLREADKQAPGLTSLVNGFLGRARKRALGSGVELAPGLWAAVCTGAEAWAGAWAGAWAETWAAGAAHPCPTWRHVSLPEGAGVPSVAEVV